MSALGKNAVLLSNNVQAQWMLENDSRRIQLASVFPFHPIAGDSLSYATTPALQPGVTIGFGDRIIEDTKMPSDPNRVFQFAEIATRFQISYKAQDIFSSNVNDQTSVQMALAIRELLYKFWTLFESGDSTHSNEFDGLLNLVDPTRVVDLDFQPLTLEVMEQAKEYVRSNDGRGAVMFTNSIGKRAISAAHWTRGLTPEYEEMMFACPCNENKPEHVLTFDGAPLYVNDLNQQIMVNADGESGASSEQANYTDPTQRIATNIWFFVMGENNLHGMTPAALESNLFVTRSTLQEDGSTLDYHVTMPAGIALGSASSLAVVKNALIPTNSTSIVQGAK